MACTRVWEDVSAGSELFLEAIGLNTIIPHDLVLDVQDSLAKRCYVAASSRDHNQHRTHRGMLMHMLALLEEQFSRGICWASLGFDALLRQLVLQFGR